jgi:hypothetical protein
VVEELVRQWADLAEPKRGELAPRRGR